MIVGQDGDGLGAEEVVVPDAQQAQQHRQIASARGRCENARPWRESRRASRGNCPARWPASATGRWPNRTSSGRRPNPRIRTCWPYRCRTWTPRPRWSRRPRSAWRPPFRPSAATHHERAEWALVNVSSVVNVFDEMMNSVSAGSRPCRASAMSVPSMFETKRNVMSRRL